jgi:hypothetical protein
LVSNLVNERGQVDVEDVRRGGSRWRHAAKKNSGKAPDSEEYLDHAACVFPVLGFF